MMDETSTVEVEGLTWRNALKGVVFLVLCGIVVVALSILFEPFSVGHSTNNDTIKGIYAQPQGKTEVASFGTSTVHAAFSPMELYERHGISAYNCATSIQSMLSSYYLLKDMIRLQGSSLKVAVLDPTVVVIHASDARKRAQAERVILGMDPSTVKVESIVAAAQRFAGYGLVNHLVPIVAYHSRWNDLSTGDFELLAGASGNYSSHGQYIRYTANVEDEKSKVASKVNGGITDARDFTVEELEDVWDKKEKRYLDDFVEACRANGTEVVFIKTPRTDWGDLQHDSAVLLAENYEAPFIDFSSEEMMKQLDLTYALDFVDKKHANAHGAQKITSYLGSFLVENYDLSDVREDGSYAYLADDAAQYDEAIEDSQLMPCQDFEEYLGRINRDRYTVFIATKGDASAGLTEAMKEGLRELGLNGLAAIGEGDSYVGVIDGGEVLVDQLEKGKSKPSTATGVYRNDAVNMTPTKLQPNARLKNEFSLESAGVKAGNYARIKVKGSDRSENKTGINFAIYNKKTHELVDTSCFDTGGDCARVSDIELG